MAKKAEKADGSRVPPALAAIPLVGDLARSADQQARWTQEILEQNARLVAQFPATMKSFNDTLERFNQTVGRLDRAVTHIETASKNLVGPLERLAAALDPKAVRDLPELLDVMRKEAGPALRAAADTQRQVALLQSTVERVVTALSELPGAGVLRRLGTGRDESDATPRPKPARGE